MTRFLTILAGLALAWAFAPAAFADDAGECATVDKIVSDTNQGAPYMVDSVTRSEVAAADCAGKVVAFTWSILADAATLNPDWRDVLRDTFDKGFCADPVRAGVVTAGWAITARWTTRDGTVYATQVACS